MKPQCVQIRAVAGTFGGGIINPSPSESVIVTIFGITAQELLPQEIHAGLVFFSDNAAGTLTGSSSGFIIIVFILPNVV